MLKKQRYASFLTFLINSPSTLTKFEMASDRFLASSLASSENTNLLLVVSPSSGHHLLLLIES